MIRNFFFPHKGLNQSLKNSLLENSLETLEKKGIKKGFVKDPKDIGTDAP